MNTEEHRSRIYFRMHNSRSSAFIRGVIFMISVLAVNDKPGILNRYMRENEKGIYSNGTFAGFVHSCRSVAPMARRSASLLRLQRRVASLLAAELRWVNYPEASQRCKKC
jgi:hypothetical protein